MSTGTMGDEDLEDVAELDGVEWISFLVMVVLLLLLVMLLLVVWNIPKLRDIKYKCLFWQSVKINDVDFDQFRTKNKHRKSNQNEQHYA